MTREEMTTHNVNDRIKFKPTPRGQEIMHEYLTRDGLNLNWGTFYYLDEDGYVTMPLWEAMRLFGPLMRMGAPKKDNCIVGNSITFID